MKNTVTALGTCLPVACCLALSAVPAMAQDVSPPERPDNLRSEVYSRSAAELFWDRSPVPGLRYEVSRDGQPVRTTGGTSAFLSGLSGANGQRFEVVTIGADGQRSAAAAVTLGGSDGAAAPTAPANLRLEVYSRIAAELFWNRPPASEGVVETLVVRNGETLESTNGTSFFDDGRVRGVDYRYELIAVDSRGRRSAPAAIGRNGTGTDPDRPTDGTPEAPVPDGFDLPAVSQDLIRALAGYQLDQLAVVVDGLALTVEQATTIVWPTDDWYQVQNAETYASVCNGGAECRIVPGRYVVINHSTGERRPLEVAYVPPAERAEAVPLPASSYATTYPELRPVTVDIERLGHPCEGGGSMTRESGAADLFNFVVDSVSGLVRRDAYVFEQCRVTVRDGLIPDGSYLVQGTLQTESMFAYGGSEQRGSYAYEDFSIVGDNGLSYTVQGRTDNFYESSFRFLERRDVAIARYEKSLPGGRPGESITDGTFDLDTLSFGVSFLASESLAAGGTVSSALTAGQRVEITTLAPLAGERDRIDGQYVALAPYGGSIEMLAEDGSFVYVNGNPSIGPGSRPVPLLDLDYTAADGRQALITGVERLRPASGAPLCNRQAIQNLDRLQRDELTGRLTCLGELEFVIP